MKYKRINNRKVIMDELDGKILKALQDEFPLSERPYDILARNLQITTDELSNTFNK